MQEPTPQSEPISLEMSRRSKIGCTLIVAGFVLLVVIATLMERAKGRAEASASAMSIYASVQRGDYGQIERLITPSAVATFKKATEVNGPISAFQITGVDPGPTGRPTTVYVLVTRKGKDYVDVVGTLDNIRLAVVEEYPKEDFENHRNDRVIREFAK